MDLRNVVFAIALSFAVLFGWSVIFETPQIEEQKRLEQTQGSEKTDNKNTDAPSPSVNIEKEKVLNISRDDAIKSVKRVNFENENIKGSISLKGFLIDDILFKKYNTEVNSDEKVKYLNPSETNDGYFVETGWAASNITNTSLPTKNSIWKVVGNNKLSVGNPVTAEWNNKSGLTFRKRIELDEKFLFKVTQEVQNNSSQRVELYPYAQITRNQDPDVVDFYILHEGFIGVFDEDLQEEGYDDVKEKKKELERQVSIQVLDACWKRHLQNIDSLRGNIGLRAYAQRNPINEFKKESFELFDSMIESFKDDSVKILFNIKIQKMSQAEFEARNNTT